MFDLSIYWFDTDYLCRSISDVEVLGGRVEVVVVVVVMRDGVMVSGRLRSLLLFLFNHTDC